MRACVCSDDMRVLQSIKSKLMKAKDNGTADALRFHECHRTLVNLNALRNPTAALHLLDELGDARAHHNVVTAPKLYQVWCGVMNGVVWCGMVWCGV